ncbi:phosphoribosyltransferase [Litchfieldella qijiaojingensis]|uniref:Phosphoribosyltransferase n=1 Tax=Litchfieldella qijiaojingensis TaxID=980347 RepID=A0ABQ2YPW4_9GAMM|nr:ComF family protein [Halomonas qijiaojingensis]GGX90920.1 phosphoribosyltransferase [Halomonas qijiaojingensis]
MDKVNEWLRHALPGHCAFCMGATQPGKPWCEPCVVALPWNLPACPQCAEPMTASDGKKECLCGACLSRPPSFVRARVPLRYEDEIALLVQRFKFSASPRAGNLLVALLEQALHRELGRPGACNVAWPDGLVSVPLHPRRARQRGFDQADWLASRLGKRLGVSCHRASRHRMTPSQRGLTSRERRANLRQAFSVPTALPARVALVDDVMTTGATLEALGQACLAAGAQEIEVWAVARTPKP